MVQRAQPPGPGEAAFHTVFDASNDAILLADPQTRTSFDANPAACRVFGYRHDELVGLRTADLIHPDYLEVYDRVAGQPHDHEVLLGRRKDGSPVDMEVSTRTIVDGGRPIRCSVLREVTQRARALELMEARVEQRTK